MKNVIRNNYGRFVAVPAMLAITSVPALAQTETGGGVDASAATDAFSGVGSGIVAIGGALLGACGAIAGWKYLKAAIAS